MAEIQRVGMPARAKVKWSLPQAPLGMTEHNKPNRSSTSKFSAATPGSEVIPQRSSPGRARAAAQGKAKKDLKVTRWVYGSHLLPHTPPPPHPDAILVGNVEGGEIGKSEYFTCLKMSIT